MHSKTTMKAQKQPKAVQKKNTLETLQDLGSGMVKKTASQFGDIGSGMLDQLLGNYDSWEEGEKKNTPPPAKEQEQQKPKDKQEGNVFNFKDRYEKEIVQNEIKQLLEQIRQEIRMIKNADKSLLHEVKDIEKLSLESMPEKTGIYYVRFLEFVLNILRSVRAKVNESRTWLEAMQSKRKKRGSAFASLSKKKGTQYSLSQELQASRSTQ